VPQKKKKKDSPWTVVLMVLLGAASGLLTVWLLRQPGQELEGYPGLLWLLAAVVVGQEIQMIAHEGGHLIFGLLTGYRFLSFRIHSLMLCREGERLVFRRCQVLGTGGQCLMLPPEGDGDDVPYVLYNLGGVLMNLIVTALLGAAYWLWRPAAPISYFLLFSMLLGAFFAISNGIPMRLSGIANDGYNALSLGSLPQARRALRMQLQMVCLSFQGVRMKDMPEEIFDLPEDADLGDPMVCAVAYMRVARAMDGLRIEEAQALAEEYLRRETGMLGLHRNELACELMFCELLGGRRQERLKELNTKEVQKYVRATAKRNISRCRLLYARALLADGDRAEAGRQKARFERLAQSHAYRAEVDGERELMALAEQKASRPG